MKRFLATLLALAMLCGMIPAVLAAENAWADWNLTSSWSISDAETLTCTGTDLGAAHFATYNVPLNTNCVSAQLKMDAAANTGNAKFGINILGSDGAEYSFFFASGNEGGYASILKIQNGTETYLNTSGAYPSITIGQWTEFKVVYNAGSASFYVGGNLLHTIYGDYASAFNGGYFRIYSYGTPISMKNLSVEPEKWSYDSSWAMSSDGVLSYSGTDSGAAHYASYIDSLDTNCVSVDLRLDGAPGGNGNFGIHLTTRTGDGYFFRYHADGYSQIIHNPAAGGEIGLNTNSNYPSVPQGEWVNFTVIYNGSSVNFYIGGRLAHSVSGDYASIFEGATLRVQSYYCPISAKLNSLEPQLWTGDSAWTIGSDGVLSYNGSDSGAAHLASYNYALDTNCVSVDLRMDGAPGGNGNMGISVLSRTGDSYFFRYHADGYSQIIHNPAAGGEIGLNTNSNYPSVSQGQWTNFKLIYDENAVYFFINNQLAHKVSGDFATLFAGATLRAQSYYIPVSVKLDSVEAIELSASDWNYADPWHMNSEGSISYAGTDGGAAHMAYYKNTLDTNFVSADLRMDGTPGGNGNMGISVITAAGDTYFFRYHADGYSNVIHYPAAGGEIFLNTNSFYPSVPQGQWANFKLIYDSNAVNFYVNDQLAHTISGDFATLFAGATLRAQSYYTPVSVKLDSAETIELSASDWNYSSPWYTNAEGSISYAGTDGGAAHMAFYKNTLDANLVSVDLRMDGAPGGNGNMGVSVVTTAGDVYFFRYHADGYSNVIHYPAAGGENFLNTNSFYPSVPQGQWTNFKLIYDEEGLDFYVGGQLAHSISGDFATLFAGATLRVQSYYTPVSAKLDEVRKIYPFTSYWQYSDWVLNTDEAEDYLTYEGREEVAPISHIGPVTVDQIDFSVRVDEAPGRDNANYGLNVKCLDGNSYFFFYCTYSYGGGQYFTIRRVSPEGVESYITPYNYVALENGQWHDLSVELKSDYIALYADGQQVCYYAGDFGENFVNSTAKFTAYDTKVSVKFEPEEQEPYPKVNYDFEFDNADSTEYFTAENGTISHEESVLAYTITGANSSLKTPIIVMAQGEKYSALASLRNTVFLRLKNETAATELKVTLIADSGAESILLPVAPNSDYTSYFANFAAYDFVGYVRYVVIEPVGVSEGTIRIDGMSFEREAEIVDYPGEVSSCLADFTAETVTVTGTLPESMANQTVDLYETGLENFYSELIPSEKIASVTADGTSFTFTISLYMTNGKTTRLSSLFLVGVGDTLLDERFVIENGASYEENPYAFTLPELTVDVTDFGAKGDAFTDDTAAIQAAIDYVAEQGGGKVVIPGEPDNFYGRRYVITNVKLKSNIELHIEEGAVLWQSPRAKDYSYDIFYGHNVVLPPPAQWTESAQIAHRPLVEGIKVENVKITGKGIIRAMDYGCESITGADDAQTWWIGCESQIHVNPIGFSGVTNLEISGVSIYRTPAYHILTWNGENIYYSDIWLLEATCGGGDGFNICGCENVMVNRCFAYTNDDHAMGIMSIDDPRNELSWWTEGLDYQEPPYQDNRGCHNYTYCHNNIAGRPHGITFISWGSGDPDASNASHSDLNIYDNTLNMIGTWCDNPFYGDLPFDNSETDDYSSVYNIRIMNNVIKDGILLGSIKATNLVTDVEGIHSHNQFIYGDFERRDEFHPEWITSLANWTVISKGGTAASVENSDGHWGKVTGKAILAQGLYMEAGPRTFTAEVAVESGNARLIVQDILTGEILAEQAVSGNDLTEYTITFEGTNRNLYLGVETLTDDAVVYLDKCKTAGEGIEDVDYSYVPKVEILLSNSPDLFGWDTDEEEGEKDFSQWSAHDVSNIIATYDSSKSSHRIWKSMIADENNFTVDLDVIGGSYDTAYIKALGVIVELDGRSGNGGQFYLKINGEHYHWVDGRNGEVHVTLSRENGGDLFITLTGREKETYVYAATPTESNENVEIGVYAGTINFRNITAASKTYYTVTWNVDGEEIYQVYESGETPFFSGDTTKESDGTYVYYFAGWDKELVPVTANATYIAQYTKTLVTDTGWDTDEIDGNKDFSGWSGLEGLSVSAVYSETTGNHRIWRGLIHDQENFTVYTEYTVQAESSAYIKLLGQTLELDARNGNGAQLGVKLNGTFQGWIAADGLTAKVYLTREEGGDIKVGILTNDSTLLAEYSMTPSENSENVELGIYAGTVSFANIAVTEPMGDIEALKNPGDFGWENDTNAFGGWIATDEANFSATYDKTIHSRVWKGLLKDQDNFIIDLDITNDNASTTYVKVLGVTIELDSNNGDGNQTFMKVGGVNYDWLSGNGCKFHVTIRRENGGDLSVTVTGQGNETAFTATASPTENNENVELGLYRGISKFENITVVSGEAEPTEVEVKISHTVSFDSDLQMNYRIKLEDILAAVPNYVTDGAYLTVEKDRYPMGGGEKTVETVTLYPDLTTDAERMLFNLAGIQSVEMGSELRAVLHFFDAEGNEYYTTVDIYSVLAYAELCFDYYDPAKDAYLFTMLIDCLNYGAAAQVAFDRRADELVNAGLEAYQQYASTELSTELTDVRTYVENDRSITAVTAMGFTVTFADKTEINAKLTIAEGYTKEDITSVKVLNENGEEVAVLTQFTELDDGRLQVTFTGMKSVDMRNMYYFVAYVGDQVASQNVGYSIEAYAKSNIASTDANAANLARACIYYGDSAKIYFDSLTK